VIAFVQRFLWRIGPLAFVIHNNGTNLLVVIVDIHRAARLGFAAQGWRLIVGGVAGTYRPLLVAHVIVDNDIFRRGRSRGVDNNREGSAGTRVARSVSRGNGEGVLTIRQCAIRGEHPLTAAVRLDGTNHFPVVEDRHNVARCRTAAQGWGGVVGGFAFLHWANVRLGVVHHTVDGRLGADRDQNGNVVRRCFPRDAVAYCVLGFQRQLIKPFHQRGIERQRPVAIIVDHS